MLFTAVHADLSRASIVNLLISAGHLVLFAGFIWIDGTGGRAALLAAIAGLSLVAWLAASRRYHLIHDTPTSKLRSAAQGYVELVGTGDLFPGEAVRGPMSLPPCLWYTYSVYEKEGDKWRHLKTERSDDTFLLKNEADECVVDPDDAEVYTSHSRSWNSGRYRYAARYLLPGERLYALGELRTTGAGHATLDKSQDVSAMLRDWKKNPGHMLDRFDANGDGSIDVQEWEAARKAAEREVDKQHLEVRLEKEISVLRAPRDGRPFLLANQDPERLARRYRYWSWLHMAVLAGAAVAALGLWTGAIR